MATLKDLARDLNLSVTQVSRALNGHADVSRETKARVREAALRIGYRPNPMARKLKSGRSGIVGMIVPGRSETVEIELLMETVMGLSAEFSRRGLQFVLHVLSAGEDPVAAQERLVRGGAIDGVVLTDPHRNDPRIAALEAGGIPFIVHGRDRPRPTYPWVDIDNRAVGRTLAEALIAQGARRIARVEGPADRPYAAARRLGSESALEEAGLILACDLPGLMTERRGVEAGAVLAEKGIDGVIAGNMMLAAGLSAALGGVPIAAHDDAIPHYGPDRVTGPLFRTSAPLGDAWVPLCDGLAEVIEGACPQVLLPVRPLP